MNQFKVNVMNHRIWHLHYHESQKATAEWDDLVDVEQIFCPQNEGHRRGGKRISELSVILLRKKIPDFVWTWFSECLIQDHILDAFQQAKFTGFMVQPAIARFKKPSISQPPRLWEFRAVGWGGCAPPASGVRLLIDCPSCGYLHYSGCTDPNKMFDQSNWDGSDFFMIWPYPRFIFVTGQVREFILDHKFSGVSFTQLKDLVIDRFGFGAGPGRLNYFMPKDRAHQIGDALGIY